MDAPLILITGGNGFIGSHLAQKLADDGCRVRVVDIAPRSFFDTRPEIEIIQGNLCDPKLCAEVVNGVNTVIHLAATMGGMGTIHKANDFAIYSQNHNMSTNILSASIKATTVSKFLYASSACVYPESLQDDPNRDVSLREEDAYTDPRSPSQGLYGQDKRNFEQVLTHYRDDITIYIARFHNVYGPRGSWRGGREKVPAALLRKALAAKLIGDFPTQLEVWGDGTQRRSFCFISDAVEGIVRLLDSDYHEPVNVGSEEAVSINDLAAIAARCAGIDDSQLSIHHVLERPVGVGSRNSNNDLARRELKWSPEVKLSEGMKLTATWLEEEITRSLNGLDEHDRMNALQAMKYSDLVDLNQDRATFALLLPITSRLSNPLNQYLNNLSKFARSLLSTTRRDAQGPEAKFRYRVYLAIDHDDEELLDDPGTSNKAESFLRSAGITDIVSILCNRPRGHVCRLWGDCARQAWKDGCDYFLLVGDDITFQDEGWMKDIHATFNEMATERNVPLGLGCVAFTDTTFPGMPTFPIVHRTHMEIFHGLVVPDVFINQDGDPFLFQLYRRFNCAMMIQSRISNSIGGSDDARYEKQHTKGWTFSTLTEATTAVEWYLVQKDYLDVRMLTLDIIIPSYRVNLNLLENILNLKPGKKCSVMFIIIIDDPFSSDIQELEKRHGRNPFVRIRVNKKNLGASASRNRGLQESAGEWVHFLDDDIVPEVDLLVKAEEAIRNSPKAAGFVGTTLFPRADSVFTTAVHLAGVTYFWDIARKIKDDVPWGVTANLIARRDVDDGVVYDLRYPKTGGGEDIDYCRKKRGYSLAHGGDGFVAAPDVVATHPYWNQGRRSYWRFYMWAKGDGALIRQYQHDPSVVYHDYAFNAGELLALCPFASALIAFLVLARSIPPQYLFVSPCLIISILCVNIVHDMYRHAWKNPERTQAIDTSIGGHRWYLAIIESTFIRIFSEMGRAIGVLERGEFGLVGWRFEWFAGVWGDGPKTEERMNNVQRLVLSSVVFVILSYFCT